MVAPFAPRLTKARGPQDHAGGANGAAGNVRRYSESLATASVVPLDAGPSAESHAPPVTRAVPPGGAGIRALVLRAANPTRALDPRPRVHDNPLDMSRPRWRSFVITWLTLAAGCGGSTTPTAPTSTGPGVATIDVYNHTQGLIQHVTKQTESGSVLLSVDELRGNSDVDRHRMVVRAKGSAGLVGTWVDATNSGSMLVSVGRGNTASYDVFLFNNSAGTNYACLDKRGPTLNGIGFAPSASQTMATLGRFVTGQRISVGGAGTFTIVDGPDEPVQQAVSSINAALNPFGGLAYGRLDYRGVGVQGTIEAGYTRDLPSGMGYATVGSLFVLPGGTPDQPYPDWFLKTLFMHELFHLFIGVGDYYDVPECGGTLNRLVFDYSPSITDTVTRQGIDALCYWKLMVK